MKLTDAIRAALAKKKGEQPAVDAAAPDATKQPGPRRGAPVANKPPRKSAGRGR